MALRNRDIGKKKEEGQGKKEEEKEGEEEKGGLRMTYTLSARARYCEDARERLWKWTEEIFEEGE